MPRKNPGITIVHRKACATRHGARCSCTPSHRAEAWDRATSARVYRTFPTAAAAKSWRSLMQVRIASGEAGAMDSPTLAAAWAVWYERAVADVILNNRGQRYKPSVLRGYEQAMRSHVLPALGGMRLSDIRVPHVQHLVDTMVGSGAAPRTVRNTVAPLRVVFKDAIRREQTRLNPSVGLALPSGETVRDRIAAPAEVITLLGGLLERDRPMWAVTFYAGLRAGELMALDVSSIDRARKLIRVERSYDPKAREFVTPKTKQGRRDVPYPAILEPYLDAVRGRGLAFGSDYRTPFQATTVRKRARKAWGAAGVEPITPHEARHTYASLMLASGVDMVKVSKWMGHSTIQITVDRYGHLVPGDETDAMRRFDDYLTRG